jgi:hypothetical protein
VAKAVLNLTDQESSSDPLITRQNGALIDTADLQPFRRGCGHRAGGGDAGITLDQNAAEVELAQRGRGKKMLSPRRQKLGDSARQRLLSKNTCAPSQ